MLYGLLALVSLILTGLSYWLYTTSGGNNLYLAGIIVFLIGTIGLGGMFLSGRVNKKEDIHITE